MNVTAFVLFWLSHLLVPVEPATWTLELNKRATVEVTRTTTGFDLSDPKTKDKAAQKITITGTRLEIQSREAVGKRYRTIVAKLEKAFPQLKGARPDALRNMLCTKKLKFDCVQSFSVAPKAVSVQFRDRKGELKGVKFSRK